MEYRQRRTDVSMWNALDKDGLSVRVKRAPMRNRRRANTAHTAHVDKLGKVEINSQTHRLVAGHKLPISNCGGAVKLTTG